MQVLLISLNTFEILITADLIPDTQFVDIFYNSISDKTVEVDFDNKRVIFPIKTNDNEPFKNGFFYLHIEVNPSCMAGPYTSSCSSM